MDIKIARAYREGPLEASNGARVGFAGVFRATTSVPRLKFRFVQRASAAVRVSGLSEPSIEIKGVSVTRYDSCFIWMLNNRETKNFKSFRVSAAYKQLCAVVDNLTHRGDIWFQDAPGSLLPSMIADSPDVCVECFSKSTGLLRLLTVLGKFALRPAVACSCCTGSWEKRRMHVRGSNRKSAQCHSSLQRRSRINETMFRYIHLFAAVAIFVQLGAFRLTPAHRRTVRVAKG